MAAEYRWDPKQGKKREMTAEESQRVVDPTAQRVAPLVEAIVKEREEAKERRDERRQMHQQQQRKIEEERKSKHQDNQRRKDRDRKDNDMRMVKQQQQML